MYIHTKRQVNLYVLSQKHRSICSRKKDYLYILQRESSRGNGQGLVRKYTCIYSRENPVEGLVKDWLESIPVYTLERIQQRDWLGSGQKVYLYILQRESSRGTGQGLVRKHTCIYSRENPVEGLVRVWLESIPVYTPERIQWRDWLRFWRLKYTGETEKVFLHLKTKTYSKIMSNGQILKIIMF